MSSIDKMKFMLLILLAALCVVHCGRKRRTNHVVSVEVDMPWHVKFSIPVDQKLEPLNLRAKVRHPTDLSDRLIEFSSHTEGGAQIFRNMKPERLRVNDVIYAVLEYKTKGQTAPMHVAFNYVIKTKQFDMIYLNTETEHDTADEATQNESDEYEDMGDASAVVDTKSPVAAASTMQSVTVEAALVKQLPTPIQPTRELHSESLQQQPELVCLSHEEMAAKAAEKQYLEEQLKTALEIGAIGTRLKLTGSLPPGNNAADAIRSLITDKLQLPLLSQSILQARFVQNELLFELATPEQKLEVLTKARLLLQRSPYKITNTDRDVFEVGLFARSN